MVYLWAAADACVFICQFNSLTKLILSICSTLSRKYRKTLKNFALNCFRLTSKNVLLKLLKAWEKHTKNV